VKLLKRDNPHLQEQLNSDTAADWSKRLYSVTGLRMSKVSHAARASGAQVAELNGVAEGQASLCSFDLPGFPNLLARRSAARGWNNDQMTGCYLTNLPFEFMRGQADFEPAFLELLPGSRRPASGESSTAGLVILGSLAGGASWSRGHREGRAEPGCRCISRAIG
jgi:hypothetical protein